MRKTYYFVAAQLPDDVAMQQVLTIDSKHYGDTKVWLVNVKKGSQIAEGIMKLYDEGLKPDCNSTDDLAILEDIVQLLQRAVHYLPQRKFVKYVAKQLGITGLLTPRHCLLVSE